MTLSEGSEYCGERDGRITFGSGNVRSTNNRGAVVRRYRVHWLWKHHLCCPQPLEERLHLSTPGGSALTCRFLSTAHRKKVELSPFCVDIRILNRMNHCEKTIRHSTLFCSPRHPAAAASVALQRSSNAPSNVQRSLNEACHSNRSKPIIPERE